MALFPREFDQKNPEELEADAVLRVKRMAHAHELPLPAYETPGSAGMDIRAAIEAGSKLSLLPGERALVPTGLMIELATGFEAQIRPRSGLAAKHGVTVLNSPGTIDSDYRGEIKIILVNLGQETFVVSRGMRVAQMVIAPVVQARLELVDELSDTSRGAGGFGSTGKMN